MKIFISGGCKNGKSTIAETFAIKQCKNNNKCNNKYNSKKLYYLATMIASDNEDLARIKKHQISRKNFGFETIEIKKDVANYNYDANASFLLDSTTALLANEMFGININPDAHIKVANDLTKLLNSINDIVIVSDYIYSDAIIYDALTEKYRENLAYIDRTCAELCDIVIEVCYGNLIIYKGNDLI